MADLFIAQLALTLPMGEGEIWGIKQLRGLDGAPVKCRETGAPGMIRTWDS